MSKSTEQPWHILGAGAIGSLWGAYGCRAGRDIKLIFRDNTQVDDYQNLGGISLSYGHQNELVPVPACSPETLSAPISQLLICTKAQQTLSALFAIKEFIVKGTTLVLLQNGLGVAEKIYEQYPQASILQASTTEGAFRQSRFELTHAGRGTTLLGQSGSLNSIGKQAILSEFQLAKVAQSLSFSPLEVKVSLEIDKELWKKLAINCIINPLTVKYNCRNGELLNNLLARHDMQILAEEINQVLNATGQIRNHQLLQTAQNVATNTALNYSSMLQDVRAKRETEIMFITGFLCQLASKNSLELPLNSSLMDYISNL